MLRRQARARVWLLLLREYTICLYLCFMLDQIQTDVWQIFGGINGISAARHNFMKCERDENILLGAEQSGPSSSLATIAKPSLAILYWFFFLLI